MSSTSDYEHYQIMNSVKLILIKGRVALRNKIVNIIAYQEKLYGVKIAVGLFRSVGAAESGGCGV